MTIDHLTDSLIVDPHSFYPRQSQIDRYWESEQGLGLNARRGFHEDCAEQFYHAKYGKSQRHYADSHVFDLEEAYEVTGCASEFLEPPQSMTTYRERWLRESIVQDLQCTLRNRLPLEIYDIIARYCIRERATRITRHTLRMNANCGRSVMKSRFDGKSSFWVHYVEIEGLKYVNSISYGHESDSLLFDADLLFNATLLFDATTYTGLPLNIYFAEDYRGIRQIIVTESDEPPFIDREEGFQWVICRRRQKAPFFFQCKTDVSKYIPYYASHSHV